MNVMAESMIEEQKVEGSYPASLGLVWVMTKTRIYSSLLRVLGSYGQTTESSVGWSLSAKIPDRCDRGCWQRLYYSCIDL